MQGGRCKLERFPTFIVTPYPVFRTTNPRLLYAASSLSVTSHSLVTQSEASPVRPLAASVQPPDRQPPFAAPCPRPHRPLRALREPHTTKTPLVCSARGPWVGGAALWQAMTTYSTISDGNASARGANSGGSSSGSVGSGSGSNMSRYCSMLRWTMDTEDD